MNTRVAQVPVTSRSRDLQYLLDAVGRLGLDVFCGREKKVVDVGQFVKTVGGHERLADGVHTARTAHIESIHSHATKSYG